MRKWLYLFLLIAIFLNGRSQSMDSLSMFPGEARDDGVAVFLSNKIFCGTGFSGSFQALNDWWSFDISSETWQKLADIPFTPRQYVRAFVYENYIYLFAGRENVWNVFKDLWRYDVTEGSWKRMRDLPGPERWGGFVFVIDNKAYIGMGNGYEGTLSDWYEYDIWKDEWELLNDFPGGARSRGVGLSVNGMGIVGMGDRDDSVFYDDFWRYIPKEDRWLKFDIKLDERLNYINSCSYDSKMHLYGGTDSNFAFSPSYWKVDLLNNTIEKKDSLPLLKTRGASMLSDDSGNIYLLWGYRSDGSKSSTLYRAKTKEERRDEKMQIFPNPAKNYIYIQFSEKADKLWLMDRSGKQVENIEVEGKKYFYLNTAKFSPGLYFVRYCAKNNKCPEAQTLLISK